MTTLENQIRRDIVTLLRDHELSAGEISDKLHRRRPAISHHLATLLGEDLVHFRTMGPYRYYRLNAKRTLDAWNAYLREGVAARSWTLV
jgi:DNA-binding transcriptional ArsR family regulator